MAPYVHAAYSSYNLLANAPVYDLRVVNEQRKTFYNEQIEAMNLQGD